MKIIFRKLLDDMTLGITNSKGNVTKTDFAQTVLKSSDPLCYRLRATQLYPQGLTQSKGKVSLQELLWQLLSFFICGEVDPGL